jgi:hypothetical protein
MEAKKGCNLFLVLGKRNSPAAVVMMVVVGAHAPCATPPPPYALEYLAAEFDACVN